MESSESLEQAENWSGLLGARIRLALLGFADSLWQMEVAESLCFANFVSRYDSPRSIARSQLCIRRSRRFDGYRKHIFEKINHARTVYSVPTLPKQPGIYCGSPVCSKYYRLPYIMLLALYKMLKTVRGFDRHQLTLIAWPIAIFLPSEGYGILPHWIQTVFNLRTSMSTLISICGLPGATGSVCNKSRNIRWLASVA